MYKKITEIFHNPNLAILFLRIAVSIVFISAGWQKIQNMDGVIAFFTSFGFASFFAYIVAYTELIGGTMILLGIFSRFFSILLALVMLIATLKIHLMNGFLGVGGYEYTLVLFFILLSLSFMGDGKFSVLKIWKRS